MKHRHRWAAALTAMALATTTLGVSGAQAAEDKKVASPAPSGPTYNHADIEKLSFTPEKVVLKGSHDRQQVVITASLKNGRQQDVTGDIKYAPAANLVQVSSDGRVLPVADGSTSIKATIGGKNIDIPVVVTDTQVNLPINFANQVVPVFTKLGCNGGGCHGKASGQNGFKLSLLGFEPELDYMTLVKEGRGRRLFPADPDNSLLLLKAIGSMPHGGGKKMEKDSDEYRMVRRWVAAGMPLGSEKDPTVTKISVFPERRALYRNNKQQLSVTAHYSDGSVQDITRAAQYESNDTDIAIVETTGLVQSNATAGEAAVMVRYQGHVAVHRAGVPLDAKTPDYQFPVKTLVDTHTSRKWKELNLVPSDLCTDEEFIRRVSVQVCGSLPTPAEVEKFLADTNPNKRDVYVDGLMERTEYSFVFANKWADILRVKRRNLSDRARGTFAFHDWIRTSIAQDKGYDQFVREILAASGDELTHPPTVWYKELTDPQQFVDDTAQVFLGLRIACAQCHHHPYEKWSQDDYWGMAAFFGRVARKQVPQPGVNSQNQQASLLRVYAKNTGTVTNKRTNQPAKIKALDAEPMEIAGSDDPRHRLVDWMTQPTNPFFARAVVNRYWAHFFGRGLVDPLDDMRVTNPASNEELLDALAKDFIANKFSMKHLVKMIVKSRTYQLSAIPNEFNKSDKQNYARFYPQRMGAEILFDAVNQVTNAPGTFTNLPQDSYAPKRAIMLPDDGYTNYFLEVFGKPPRTSACECERVSEANLAQALHLLNSDEIQQKLSRAGGRADLLAQDKRDDKEKVSELFVWSFGRKASPDELKAALEHIEKNGMNKKAAFENILWALLNTKEFQFID